MSRRARIVAIVVVLGCLLGAAIIDRSGSAGTADESVFVALGPRVSAGDAQSVAWYCAEGTSNPGGRADGRVYVASVDRRPTRARVSVFSGPEQPPTVRLVDVPAGGLVGLRIGDILATPEPGVLVETTGGRAVVTHSIRRERDVTDGAVGPCARDASPEWHFSAGTTVRGAQLWLALFNPYADDAIVNIGFLTDAGPIAPNELQGLVVPSRSRVSVPVHDQARRDNLVATEVVARRGRVVAEQSQVLDGFDGRRGVSLSLGSPALSRRWEFATASISAGRSETLFLANPGNVPAEVTIRTRLDGGALEPEIVSVAPRTAMTVDLGRRVPAGIGFSAGIRSAAPVMAETLAVQREPWPPNQRGIATAIGERRGARRWVASPSRISNVADLLAVLNLAARRVTVRFRVTGATGATVDERREIEPGRRVLVNLADLGVPENAVLLVDATGPVVVERDASGLPGLTVAHAVPDLDR